MSPKGGCSGEATARGLSLGPASGSGGGAARQAGMMRRHRRAGRNSFPCLVCGKAFPSQQAMAGHCSTHTRARPNGVHPLFPAVATAITNVVPPAVVRFPSFFVPLVNPTMSNQVMVGAPPLPSVQLMPSPSGALRVPAQHRIHAAPAPQLLLGTLFRYFTFLPLPPPPAATAAGAVAPSLSLRPSSYPAANQQPARVCVDLTLQLGATGGSSSHAQKRTSVPLLADGPGGKKPVVVDGGDHGGAEEGEDMDGVDLELRLCP